jgi:hypothetical protein
MEQEKQDVHPCSKQHSANHALLNPSSSLDISLVVSFPSSHIASLKVHNIHGTVIRGDATCQIQQLLLSNGLHIVLTEGPYRSLDQNTSSPDLNSNKSGESNLA